LQNPRVVGRVALWGRMVGCERGDRVPVETLKTSYSGAAMTISSLTSD
jgi:hypothetical protein